MKRLISGIAMVMFIVPLAHADKATGHCAEMMQAANDAVEHGMAGHADILADHAESMLDHAGGCKKSGISKVSMGHLDEAVAHMEEALEHAKAGNADKGLDHAQASLKHAKEVH